MSETTALMLDPDLAVRVQIELGYMRQQYVDDQVSRALARVEGDMSKSRIEDLSKQAVQRWNERHPALCELWFDALRSRV